MPQRAPIARVAPVRTMLSGTKLRAGTMLTVAIALSLPIAPARAIDAGDIATGSLPIGPADPPSRPQSFIAVRDAVPTAPLAHATAGDDMLPLGRDIHDRMTIPVEVTGATGQHAPFAFLVDTGAERTVVARSVVNALGLVASGRSILLGTAGQREVDLVAVAALGLGQHNLYDFTSPVLDASAIGADGIVGLDGLQGQRILLDFDNNRLDLGKAAMQGGDRGYDIVIRARRKSGQLIMTDAMVDGVRTALVIDTGSDISIGNSALQHALRRDHPQVSVELVAVTGQSANAQLGVARHMVLGGMTLNNTRIAFTDAPPFAQLGLSHRPAMLLGMAQLRLFHRVAIDFARHRVLFAMPGAPPA
jgi:predicted aspartyl protease